MIDFLSFTRSCGLGFKQLDYRKRCQILGLWKAGYNQSQIAKEVGVHKSTISREFKRNITFVRTAMGSWQYKPDYAQFYADERHKFKNKKIKFTSEVQAFVREKLLEDWSPEQICGYAKRLGLFSISHERIYLYVLSDKQKGGKLYKHLRHQHKKYRKRYGSPKRTGPIRNRRCIDTRPAVVDSKSRLGDWEIDTIIGQSHKQAIVSIVERKTQKTILQKVSAKTAKLVTASTISSMKPLASFVHTITADNGSEFAYHERISKALNADFYFAHPYSSWERGLNENTNGLVRQYLKKGSSFTNVDNNILEAIMDKLNNRPRKTLGFKSPNEVFNNLAQAA